MGRQQGAGVQATNLDATASKISAVRLGYWDDPFIECFIDGRRIGRKSPLINRGYYGRVWAMRQSIDRFLACCPASSRPQIVNLGAGFDTTYFLLKHQHKFDHGLFVELDHSGVTKHKCELIQQKSELGALLTGATYTADALHAGQYHVVPCDLASLPQVKAQLAHCGIVHSEPTLVVAECVLVYIDPDASRQLIEYFGKHYPTAGFVNYEQIMHDPSFTAVMAQSFQRLRSPLVGLEAVPSAAAQCKRCHNCGWAGASALDMNQVFDCIPEEDMTRVKRLEIFDEYEEWTLMLKHYCITWAWNDATEIGIGAITISTP